MTRTVGVAVLFSGLLFGQGERGAFNGTVTDSTGSAVPNATVTAIQTETNVETKATTTDTGVYRMPYLPLGTYKFTASAPGFRTDVAQNVILRVAQTVTVDFKLEVGQVNEQITVSAESAQLESSSAEIGRYVAKTEFDT